MKKTWLLNLQKNETLLFSECGFYCKYFLIFFKFFIWWQPSLLIFKIIKKFTIIFNFSNFFVTPRTHSSHILKFKNNFEVKNNLEINFINCHLNSINNFSKFDSEKFFVNKFNNEIPYNFLKLRMFNIFFLFNYSLFNQFFKFNTSIKLFFIQNLFKGVFIINLSKFLNRWKDSYDFIFNIFYYKFNPLIFGNFIFKNEIISLNWVYNNFDINFWRYYFSFFIFKSNCYSKQADFFFEKLNMYNINFFFLTDCSYHFKNIYYLKKKKYYSIGLINATLDPWLVSYPIISFFESFVTQSFFFKLLIFIQKQSFYFKYWFFKKTWINFCLFNCKTVLK